MTDALHDTVTAALAAARETLAGGTHDVPTPWRSMPTIDPDNNGWVVAFGNSDDDFDTTVAWTPYDYDGLTAPVIVTAVNGLGASLDLIAMVVEEHAPIKTVQGRTYCSGCVDPQEHWPKDHPFPCALYRQASAALGVVCDE